MNDGEEFLDEGEMYPGTARTTLGIESKSHGCKGDGPGTWKKSISPCEDTWTDGFMWL